MDRAEKLFNWKGMQEDIDKLCRTCEACQSFAHKTASRTLGTITVERPFETIAVDFMGSLREKEGYKYVLIAVDYHTRWPEFRITKTARIEEALALVKLFKSRFGTPKRIAYDNAAFLTSDPFKKFRSNHSIEKL